MSPVSKGRKRKPGKGRPKTGVRRERPGLSGSPFRTAQPDDGFDMSAYLEDLSPGASRAEIGSSIR